MKLGAKWVFNRIDPKYQRPKFVHSIDKGLHPTQKSLGLMETLLLIHSNPGQIILDPFMGSGTTAVACINTGRKYIGFEMDRTYFDAAQKRISDKLAEIKGDIK